MTNTSQPSQLVECRTLYNGSKWVPVERLAQRPSVYGVIVSAGQLLVARGSYTHKFVLPGGGIEPGEAVEAALVREVREETGLAVTAGAFLHFETDLFYYDPLDLAFHGFMFFYQAFCAPVPADGRPGALPRVDYPPEEGLEGALWVPVNELAPEDFQSHGALITRLARGVFAQA